MCNSNNSLGDNSGTSATVWSRLLFLFSKRSFLEEEEEDEKVVEGGWQWLGSPTGVTLWALKQDNEQYSTLHTGHLYLEGCFLQIKQVTLVIFGMILW